ncbi:hypothetical protein TCAL_00940 [Tigriopus californicus]|uniref:Uncharacterized protein n=1 Tax=Tigriopus californicus TaxID=6832 RepID=A0A553P6E4_TIGCA|nr:uncharacterized protein LOC131877750 [Tigriopus californicus]TRY73190.1 hypothetical protein TCAL_00940 [Tigriopus californicus]
MELKKEWSAFGILLLMTIISAVNVVFTSYYLAFKGISEMEIVESVVKRNAQDLGPGEVICSGPDFVYVGRNQIFLADPDRSDHHNYQFSSFSQENLPDIIQTSTLRSKPTSDFEISSLNEIRMFGPKKAKLQSLGGSVKISSLKNLELNALNAIQLKSANIFIQMPEPGRPGRLNKAGFQLCSCENGMLFASVNDHPCSSDYQVCEMEKMEMESR